VKWLEVESDNSFSSSAALGVYFDAPILLHGAALGQSGILVRPPGRFLPGMCSVLCAAVSVLVTPLSTSSLIYLIERTSEWELCSSATRCWNQRREIIAQAHFRDLMNSGVIRVSAITRVTSIEVPDDIPRYRRSGRQGLCQPTVRGIQ